VITLPKDPTDLDKSMQAYLQEKSESCLNSVFEAGRGLVHHFARLHSGGGKDEDLLQSGYEGLLKAVHRFDPSRGTRFTTYASACITGEIRHELRRKNAFDRPKWAADLQKGILSAVGELLQEKGRPPTLQEISAAVNIREEGVREALKAGRVPFDELDTTQIKSIHYVSFQLPVEDRILLRQALEQLNVLQRRVVYLFFYHDLTQSEVAKQLGTTQRQVSRLLRKGLDSLARLISG
jgi:RNA polymerase sigma-B factor